MENFTPYSALLGGALLGLSAALLMLLTGRVAGIKGAYDFSALTTTFAGLYLRLRPIRVMRLINH